MEVQEKKLGRVFRLEFKKGEDFFAEVSRFAREKGIREASIFMIGAMGEGQVVTGFLSSQEGDSNRRPLGMKREFLALGTLTWPASRPRAVQEPAPWHEPQPYPHLHLALGPDIGEEQKEILVGHLNKGLAIGLTAHLYELL